MKNLFLAFSLVFTLQCIAQDPDPDLFQTWYLQDVWSDSGGPPLILIEPPIYPYITISETLDFNGQGACNTFNGTYMYDASGEAMIAIDFNNTNDDCGFVDHNTLEDDYFSLMAEWWTYVITDDGVGLQLEIKNPLDPYAIFTNYSLSALDLEIADIIVYPNPSHSKIFIESQKDQIIKIELLNLLGEILQSATDSPDSIDISDFASGIYLLRIFAEQGSTVKKIVKK